LSLKKWNKAEVFFKLNIENYPHDANGNDHIDGLYEASGDTKKAIDGYTKALTPGSDPDRRRKLGLLKTKK
jgi:hypothetical protein